MTLRDIYMTTREVVQDLLVKLPDVDGTKDISVDGIGRSISQTCLCFVIANRVKYRLVEDGPHFFELFMTRGGFFNPGMNGQVNHEPKEFVKWILLLGPGLQSWQKLSVNHGKAIEGNLLCYQEVDASDESTSDGGESQNAAW